MEGSAQNTGDGRRHHSHLMDAGALFTCLYTELHVLAARYLENERPDHTLQPTALLHEAYLRLAKGEKTRWKDRRWFYTAAARTMRQVLVDHARARLRAKRGGGWKRLPLSGLEGLDAIPIMDTLILDDALNRLAGIDERKCRVVELRCLGGLTIKETARALGVGTTTIENDWAFSRAWLGRELRKDTSR